MEVKKSQHKYIIGPKGSQINLILSETGVFVEMPSSESSSETITLRGPQDKLGLGTNFIFFHKTLSFKGQLISKCPFDVFCLRFDQKTNEMFLRISALTAKKVN